MRISKKLLVGVGVIGLVAASAALPAATASAKSNNGNIGAGAGQLQKYKHIVVIYQENHSFDNLYGLWGSVNGESVNGLAQADAAHTAQIAENGTPYNCLLQQDVNLTSPPLTATCTDPNPAVGSTAFTNAPFKIDQYIPSDAKTCPAPGVFAANGVLAPNGLPGGCTRDIVHRFYQEQYQLNGGRQNRYTTGSDATGLTQGYYDTTKLPIYQYLHGAKAPKYVVADNFFQGAFGGSFLNHQLLVAGQAPVWPGGADKSGVQTGCATGQTNCDIHSVVDTNGFPNNTYPLYKPAGNAATPNPTVKDNQLTEAADSNGNCAASYSGAVAAPAGTLCGDYAVNTTQPFTQPYQPGTQVGKRLPLLHSDNIGDQLSAKDVSWAYFAGGWDNAAGNNGRDAMHPLGPGWTMGSTGTSTGTCTPAPGEVLLSGATFPNCPDALFQFHHQPLGYFANYADNTQARVDHLKDETQFMNDAEHGTLPAVSFVKPIGNENEHPGYASEPSGSQHLVDLIKAIEDGPDGKSTMIVVTYDEFGGQWDHVPVPGTAANPGPHDAYGPGTRVPALVLAAGIKESTVDHTQYDTTSILATIEHRFDLPALHDPAGHETRDGSVNDLLNAILASKDH